MNFIFILIIYLAFVSLGLPDTLLGSAWPVMRPELGVSLDAQGLITIIVSCATILSCLLNERLVRWLGTAKITAISGVVTAAALLGYFVLTTNVDHQFQKAGFQTERIFATQGDYGNIQCEKGCHQKIYNAEDLFHQMDQARHDCLVPSYMVPKCPVCGGNMTMHLRCDQYFVEDENWHEAAGHYHDFLKKMGQKKGVLLELGVGFNTPGIIKYPFWRMVHEWKNAVYVCINAKEAYAPEEIRDRSICIQADIGEVLKQL